ncbi:MAG TPA: substrate-binding domain-containing protein [Verrucomicrobiae bacterium]|jgi:LacI family transcriptional regulator|nr:substrate-binding domain-containing protein [Verrucomicrobiae bacterium]
MRKRSPRVLLVLGWYDYRLHRGIEKYAQESGWHLSEDLAREKVIPWGWDGDGILCWLGEGDDLAAFVNQAKKPTVDFSFRRKKLKFARVLEDTAQTAQLVADHFLSRGIRHLYYYSDADNWVYNERRAAFFKFLQSVGREAGSLQWDKSSEYRMDRQAWRRRREWLTNNLKAFPKPVGIFAASDGLALELLETCENAEINVPEEVAIVGAGNSLLAVDAMQTPISSVDVNMESIGYEGAKLLDELMRREPPPPQPVRVPPIRLIARKSSDLLAVRHPGVARSLRFMWEHYHEPIGVTDLARAASMSVRNFHQVFVDHLGRSPGSELLRIRIERAKQLLQESSDKIEVIAELSGYNNNSFEIAFKRSTGMTPKQYRSQNRKGSKTNANNHR